MLQEEKLKPAFPQKCNSGKEFDINGPSIASGYSEKEQ